MDKCPGDRTPLPPRVAACSAHVCVLGGVMEVRGSARLAASVWTLRRTHKHTDLYHCGFVCVCVFGRVGGGG